jgi:hypothetical protein
MLDDREAGFKGSRCSSISQRSLPGPSNG